MGVPKLRFKEFEGAWFAKKLDKVANKISDGIHSTSAYDVNGQYYFINGNNLINNKIEFGENTKRVNTLEYLKHKSELTNQTILISINGTIGNLALYNNEKIVLGKSACYINLKPEENKYFLFSLLQTTNIKNHFAKELTGSTIKNLSLTTIKNAQAFFPSFEEQTKIANFLTAIDEKITQLTQKHDLLKQYKKGVMQQIFSQKLRFKDENGREFPEWEINELGNLASKVNLKNRNLEINNVLTNSATQGIISQNDYFDRDIANKNNLDGYYIVEIDDFVYNPRISNNAPVGPIKRNKLVKGVMSPLYTIFRFQNGNLAFFEHFFETNYWHDYMKSISNFGARHDRMNITNESFFALPISLPSIKEQTKIANFLTAIDEKISHTQTQLEAAKLYKKGLLQQMFV